MAQPGRFVLGGLIRQLWSFAGDDDRQDVSQMLAQPFVNYNLEDGRFLVSAPIVTANWEANSDDRWVVPVGGGGGRVFKIGPQPVNVGLQAYYNVEKSQFGPEWSLRRLPSVSPITLAADRGFDARDFVMELRERRVTPHIAQNTSGRRSAIDSRTTRHPGYGASQRVRKRIEEAFAWIKTIAGQSRTKLRGLARVRWSFTLAAAAYNLVRLPKLLATRGASP